MSNSSSLCCADNPSVNALEKLAITPLFLARINKVEDIIGQNPLLELIYKKFGDKTQEIPKMRLEDIENFETIMQFLNNIFMEIQGE